MFLKKIVLSFISFLVSANAVAFDLTKEPITVIIPFPPGGGVDLAFKSIQQYAGTKNIKLNPLYKSGAEGLIGMRELSQSPADGSIISITTVGVIANQKIKEPLLDTDVITGISHSTMVFVTSADSKFNNLKEVENFIKEKNTVTFAEGSPTQRLTIKQLITAIDAEDKSIIVSYRGTNPIIKDIVGNHIDVALVPLTTVYGLVESKKLKVIGISGNTFLDKFADASIVSKEYPEVQFYFGFSVNIPVGATGVVLNAWGRFFLEYISNPEIQAEMKKNYSEPFSFGKDDIDALVESMITKLK
jgi:tripartite-type tricarboxylate transporter receptor subunit TctC